MNISSVNGKCNKMKGKKLPPNRNNSKIKYTNLRKRKNKYS